MNLGTLFGLGLIVLGFLLGDWVAILSGFFMALVVKIDESQVNYDAVVLGQ